MHPVERLFLWVLTGAGCGAMGFLVYITARLPKEGAEELVITANAVPQLIIIICIGALIGLATGVIVHRQKDDESDPE
ncbi:MAG: hypothetical protein ACD_24C00012G0001 [uncultured bacterium]|uniref:Uncharacterized protein n=1 Tax=candidate division WWE3 bacterium RBG_16_37_10 TaxID=1802610 RepID=A0A1F4UVE3_UNCKA|nr:MAG: hypothetical protein ACD_24C00012G0001 [uncultured bacterium]OGC48892.1 MAG: hypothetical protein A2W32_00395 [candidate division WWE3 bacterium RBG_16_37_10]